MSARLTLYMSLLFLGGLAYLISLILDVSGDLPGVVFSLLGWINLEAINEDPFVALAWLANTLVVAASIFSSKRKNMVAIRAACSPLTLSALFF
jgi:hypothetical protein